MKLEALNDNVILSEIEFTNNSIGGILIPDMAQSKPCERVVVSIGPKATAYGLKVGDHVIRKELQVQKFEMAGKSYEQIKECEIVAKL